MAIAGLADASVPKVPGLTAQIPTLLQHAIDVVAHHDDPYWEDPAPPPEYPEEFKRFWAVDPYQWWNMLAGPMQTIFNVAATYEPATYFPPIPLLPYGLFAIVAGYQANGEPKLERLSMVPQFGVSNWSRPWVGLGRATERRISNGGVTWATIGVTDLAEAVLSQAIHPTAAARLNAYEGIQSFLERCRTGAAGEMTDGEMIRLAHDLIRATAERHPEVGSRPLQTAVLRKGQEAMYDQPIKATEMPTLLSLNGTWHLGVDFTPGEYPFASAARGSVFTFCKVVSNKSPLPLGGNFIYGSEFVNALFSYDAGEVRFGDNNRLTDCELRLAPGADSSQVRSILPLFKRVIQEA